MKFITETVRIAHLDDEKNGLFYKLTNWKSLLLITGMCLAARFGTDAFMTKRASNLCFDKQPYITRQEIMDDLRYERKNLGIDDTEISLTIVGTKCFETGTKKVCLYESETFKLGENRYQINLSIRAGPKQLGHEMFHIAEMEKGKVRLKNRRGKYIPSSYPGYVRAEWRAQNYCTEK